MQGLFLAVPVSYPEPANPWRVPNPRPDPQVRVVTLDPSRVLSWSTQAYSLYLPSTQNPRRDLKERLQMWVMRLTRKS
jgi:hypothetical protein